MTRKKLTPVEYKKKTEDYFTQWSESANRFFETFQIQLDRKCFNEAAFQLHQTDERYYTAQLLVFTDYRPKEHNLESLDIEAGMCDKRFKQVFPRENE
jgi:uncharacterized protein